MKKLLLAGVGFAALIAGPATAADLARPVYRRPVVVAAPVTSWTGFYVGGNVGGAWGNSDFTTNPNCAPAAANSTFCNVPPSPFAPNGAAVAAAGSGRLNPSGFTGGVQAGYNWQAGAFVYGVEADFNALDLKKSVATGGIFPVPFLGNQFLLTESIHTNWLATVRGRLGVTVVPSMLLYATGGVAFTDFKFSSTYNDNAIGGGFTGGVGVGSTSSVRTGWTVGGGLEWMLASNWTLKAEYLYVDLGSSQSFAVPTINTFPAFSQTMLVDADLKTHIVRVGLNYKFGYAAASAVYK